MCEQLLDSFKVLHTAGRIYNDLKPANIMISHIEDEGEAKEQVTLIDFGLATKYRKEDKTHINDSVLMETFRGNI